MIQKKAKQLIERYNVNTSNKQNILEALERQLLFHRFGSQKEKVTLMAIEKLKETIANEILLGGVND